MRRILAVLAFATLAGCNSFDPLKDNTVTGTWRGKVATGSDFVLSVQQAGSTVAGSGTVTSTAAGTRTLSISGTYQPPTFSATLTPNSGQPITLQGTVEGSAFIGTVSGGGFTGDGLALQRD
jgi:hypothetical protein